MSLTSSFQTLNFKLDHVHSVMHLQLSTCYIANWQLFFVCFLSFFIYNKTLFLILQTPVHLNNSCWKLVKNFFESWNMNKLHWMLFFSVQRTPIDKTKYITYFLMAIWDQISPHYPTQPLTYQVNAGPSKTQLP